MRGYVTYIIYFKRIRYSQIVSELYYLADDFVHRYVHLITASSRRPSSQYDTRTSTVSPDATSTATSASHPSRIENVFASTGSSNDRRRRPLTTVRLHPRGVGRRQFRRRDVGRENDEFVELSGIRFARNRWMSVSDNYRLMLDDLFINAAADNRCYYIGLPLFENSAHFTRRIPPRWILKDQP